MKTIDERIATIMELVSEHFEDKQTEWGTSVHNLIRLKIKYEMSLLEKDAVELYKKELSSAIKSLGQQ